MRTNITRVLKISVTVVSAIAGVGVAVGGKDAVQWGWNNGSGLATIFAGFIIVRPFCFNVNKPVIIQYSMCFAGPRNIRRFCSCYLYAN